MTKQEAEQWNAKYPAFYLSYFSKSQGNYVCGPKRYSDIREALKAATARDRRKHGELTFIDVKQT